MTSPSASLTLVEAGRPLCRYQAIEELLELLEYRASSRQRTIEVWFRPGSFSNSFAGGAE